MIESLKWDSDFFNLKVGKVYLTDKAALKEFEVEYNQCNFDFINVILAENEQLVRSFEETFGIKPIENKVTYCFSLENSSNLSNLFKVEELNEFSNTLERLTIESGVESRYNKDPKIEKEFFEEMYKIWIQKSLTKELADVVYGIYLESQLAGFVTLSLKKEYAQIGLIAVDKSYRGKGIAKALLEKCIETARYFKKSSLHVVTQEQNQNACKLYESVGFKKLNSNPIFHLWK